MIKLSYENEASAILISGIIIGGYILIFGLYGIAEFILDSRCGKAAKKSRFFREVGEDCTRHGFYTLEELKEYSKWVIKKEKNFLDADPRSVLNKYPIESFRKEMVSD